MNKKYKNFFLDLDGVVYNGNTAIPKAATTLNYLASQNTKITYITNNASRSPQEISQHLKNIGIDTPHTILTSVTAAINLLKTITPPNTNILTIGSNYLKQEIAAAGYNPISSHKENPQAIIQGFNPQTRWTELAEISYTTQHNIPWIATNTDLTIPQTEGTAPGNGSLTQTITNATGKHPLIAGKPQPHLFNIAAQNIDKQKTLIIGDRLDTDILGGNNANIDTALVLTGINNAWDALTATPKQRPTHIIETLEELTLSPLEILEQKTIREYLQNHLHETNKTIEITAEITDQQTRIIAIQMLCKLWWNKHPNTPINPQEAANIQHIFTKPNTNTQK